MFQIDENIKILSTTLEKIADNVMITDVNGVIKYVNPAFEATTGYSRQEVLGQTPKILRSGRQSAEYYQKLWDTILAGQVFRARVTNKRKNGDIFYSDQTISPIFSDSGEIICFVSVWKDVTEHVEFEEKLAHFNDQLVFEKKKLEQVLGIEGGLHRILDLNRLIDFVVEKTCTVLDAGKCSVMFVDHESGELCIKGHHGIEESMVTGGNFPKVGDQIELLIERYHKAKGKAGSLQIIDGSIYQSDLFLSVPIRMKDRLMGIINVSDKKGRDGVHFTDLDLKVLSMIVNQVRIAIENAKFYQELKYLAVTDPLTGLYNHRHFNKAMDYEITRAKRYKRDLAFLMIDVDHFKMYNDVFGHLEGDKILKAVANAISQATRKTDVVCRYAGDEFAVILPETSLEKAKMVAERTRQNVVGLAFRKPVSISIGMAECTAEINRHDLILRADAHLYEAKQQGRNKVAG